MSSYHGQRTVGELPVGSRFRLSVAGAIYKKIAGRAGRNVRAMVWGGRNFYLIDRDRVVFPVRGNQYGWRA